MKHLKIGIISPFPPRGKKHVKGSGVASYSKSLVTSLSKTTSVTPYILANVHSKNEEYEESNVHVLRCWTKWSFPFTILRAIRYEHFDLIHIQFEYLLYGGIPQLLLVLSLMLSLRLLGIPTVLTLHQVMPLTKIDREFLRENGFPEFPRFMKFGLKWITKLLAAIADIIIVHEDLFKKRLEDEYGITAMKIKVVPHGVELQENKFSKSFARREIGVSTKARVILYVGYISGYKGVDVLLDAIEKIKEQGNYVLILGGGIHPRMKDDLAYLERVETIKTTAEKMSSSVIFIGFIPEELIPFYISAADVLMFPYKVVFGSSGPMNLAFGYNKPVLASDAFSGILEPEMLFSLSPEEISKSITDFFLNPSKKKNILKLVHHYRTSRSWDNIGKRTVEVYSNVLSKSYSIRD